jgi:hypothetical protein
MKLKHAFLASALALLAAAPAAAQTYVFRINQAASNFVWTGTTSLGPIVGNPSNQFQFAGTVQADLSAVAPANFTSGSFTGGDAHTVPDLHGRIPNPIPIFPDLATIDVTNLHVTVTSMPFAMGPAGAFNASVVITATQGTLTVDPLTGSTTNTPLAGMTSAPTMASGAVTIVGGGLRLVVPINTTFAFTDPGSGVSGSITLTGTLDATYSLYTPFCFGDGSGTPCPCNNHSPTAAHAGCLSSIGQGGRMTASGLSVVSADTLSLDGATMPATATCLYFQGTLQENAGAGSVRGDGLFCTGGSLIRLGTRTNVAGSSSFPGASGQSVSVRGAVNPAGGTYYYQAWYRNAAAYCTPDTYNLTNGLAVTWLP